MLHTRLTVYSGEFLLADRWAGQFCELLFHEKSPRGMEDVMEFFDVSFRVFSKLPTLKLFLSDSHSPEDCTTKLFEQFENVLKLIYDDKVYLPRRIKTAKFFQKLLDGVAISSFLNADYDRSLRLCLRFGGTELIIRCALQMLFPPSAHNFIPDIIAGIFTHAWSLEAMRGHFQCVVCPGLKESLAVKPKMRLELAKTGHDVDVLPQTRRFTLQPQSASDVTILPDSDTRVISVAQLDQVVAQLGQTTELIAQMRAAVPV
jgi:hypothetical protein